MEIAHTCELGRARRVFSRAAHASQSRYSRTSSMITRSACNPRPARRVETDHLVAGPPDGELLPPGRPFHLPHRQAGVQRHLEASRHASNAMSRFWAAPITFSPHNAIPPNVRIVAQDVLPFCLATTTPTVLDAHRPSRCTKPRRSTHSCHGNGSNPNTSRDHFTKGPPNDRPNGRRVAIRGVGDPSTAETGTASAKATDISRTHSDNG